MRQLVDDHGVERLVRGQDEPPREGEPAEARGATPSGALIADGDPARADTKGPGMTGDRTLDLDRGLLLQPSPEDDRDRSSIPWSEADLELILGVAANALNARPSAGGVRDET